MQNVKNDDRNNLEKENFALAANQCHNGYSTEYGDHRCKYQDEIKDRDELIERLVEALEELIDYSNKYCGGPAFIKAKQAIATLPERFRK